MECSAKEDRNIKDVFRSYLSLSKILPQAEAAEASGGSSSGGLKRRSSAYVSNKGNRRSASPAVASTSGEEASGSSSSATLEPTGFSRFKPRSRSLIRRSSRKAKQQMRDANDDCHVS